MRTAKVAISLEEPMLKKLDRLVKGRKFESRSQAIQIAVAEKIARMDKTRLAAECAKLNNKFEQNLADEGLSQDLEEWPDY